MKFPKNLEMTEFLNCGLAGVGRQTSRLFVFVTSLEFSDIEEKACQGDWLN